MKQSYFQHKLKELRELYGFKSQAAFASAFGVAQSTVGGWESGAREPDFDTIQRLANFFSISLDELIGNKCVCLTKSQRKQILEIFEESLDNLKRSPVNPISHNNVIVLSASRHNIIPALSSNAPVRAIPISSLSSMSKYYNAEESVFPIISSALDEPEASTNRSIALMAEQIHDHHGTPNSSHFGVTADYLLGRDTSASSSVPASDLLSPADCALLAAYHAAPPEIQNIVRTALASYKTQNPAASENAAG